VTVQDRRLAVIELEEWEAMIKWLETLEDVRVAKEAYAQLEAAGSDRTRAIRFLFVDKNDHTTKPHPHCPSPSPRNPLKPFQFSEFRNRWLSTSNICAIIEIRT
jgi:hypothetical protein